MIYIYIYIYYFIYIYIYIYIRYVWWQFGDDSLDSIKGGAGEEGESTGEVLDGQTG